MMKNFLTILLFGLCLSVCQADTLGDIAYQVPVTESLVVNNSLTINKGGTLLLNGTENLYHNNPSLILNGGTLILARDGYQEFGKLTLTANSTISFKDFSSFDLFFNNSANVPWTGTLLIQGWDGTFRGGQDNHIFFDTSPKSLTTVQLNQISFEGFGPGAILLRNGELVPRLVPEIPPVGGATVIVLSLILWGGLRKKQRKTVDT